MYQNVYSRNFGALRARSLIHAPDLSTGSEPVSSHFIAAVRNNITSKSTDRDKGSAMAYSLRPRKEVCGVGGHQLGLALFVIDLQQKLYVLQCCTADKIKKK